MDDDYDDVSEDGSDNDGDNFLISNFFKVLILSKSLNAVMKKRKMKRLCLLLAAIFTCII